MEKNEFQNRVFLFSNFLGAAILNNCDVSNKRRRPGNLKTKIRDSEIRFSPL